MNRSELLLEKMQIFKFRTPLGSIQKFLLTDKPLGRKISSKLLTTGLEVNIKKAMEPVLNKIQPDMSYNLLNIFSKKQVQLIKDNPNFEFFSKEFKIDVNNILSIRGEIKTA